MVLIKVENMKKAYVNEDVVTSVLHGVNFEIKQGEFVAIMGPSGSGKSTLGFDDDTLAALRNERIGFVFQSFNLLPRTTVLDNVKLPLMYSKKKNHDELAKKALESVSLGHRFYHYTNQISGGEKQRVAIARALVNDPAVIFADEPTGNLDSKSGGTVMHILQELNRQGRTVILVTHELDTAQHASRLIKIKDGNIVADEKIKNRTLANPEGELQK
jgi:ABC-type lipoprotein export system ATPase subunit